MPQCGLICSNFMIVAISLVMHERKQYIGLALRTLANLYYDTACFLSNICQWTPKSFL